MCEKFDSFLTKHSFFLNSSLSAEYLSNYKTNDKSQQVSEDQLFFCSLIWLSYQTLLFPNIVSPDLTNAAPSFIRQSKNTTFPRIF